MLKPENNFVGENILAREEILRENFINNIVNGSSNENESNLNNSHVENTTENILKDIDNIVKNEMKDSFTEERSDIKQTYVKLSRNKFIENIGCTKQLYK